MPRKSSFWGYLVTGGEIGGDEIPVPNKSAKGSIFVGLTEPPISNNSSIPLKELLFELASEGALWVGVVESPSRSSKSPNPSILLS